MHTLNMYINAIIIKQKEAINLKESVASHVSWSALKIHQ